MILRLALIILINMVLQTTIFPYWTILGRAPNTALICIVVIALIRGKYYGGFFGLILGLLYDIMFGQVIGVNALIYFLMGYIVGMLQEPLNVNNKTVPAIITSLATIFYNFMYFFFLFFLARNIPVKEVINNIISIEIIYNGILAIFINNLFNKMFKAPSLDFRRRMRW